MSKLPSIDAILPPSVLIGAVCFNALLAIVNGHVAGLARSHVALAEMAIYGAALVIILSNADRKMLPWFLLTLFIVLMGLLIALGNGDFNPKYVRDVMVIPIFVMLGMTYFAHRFTTPFLVLHSIIFLAGALEIVSPGTYADIFRILDYYVSTRDFTANAFWNSDSTLFVSATRPGARFFGFVDWHRASSIFLEPVSLGNYCVIAAILTATCWADLSRRMRWYLIGSTFFLLVACDGRLAAVSIGVALIAGIFLRNVLTRWVVFYLPASLVAAAIFVSAFGTGEVTDNFVGRVTGTVGALSLIDFPALFGMAAGTAEGAADNGIVYFILSQSAIGVAVIWGTICLLARGRSPQMRIYIHAIAIFIPLNLLVSNSFFSIKTAALIWFFYGYLYMRESLDEERQAIIRPPSWSALRSAA